MVGFCPTTGGELGGSGGRLEIVSIIGRIVSPLHPFPVPVPSEAATVLVQSQIASGKPSSAGLVQTVFVQLLQVTPSMLTVQLVALGPS